MSEIEIYQDQNFEPLFQISIHKAAVNGMHNEMLANMLANKIYLNLSSSYFLNHISCWDKKKKKKKLAEVCEMKHMIYTILWTPLGW